MANLDDGLKALGEASQRRQDAIDAWKTDLLTSLDDALKRLERDIERLHGSPRVPAGRPVGSPHRGPDPDAWSETISILSARVRELDATSRDLRRLRGTWRQPAVWVGVSLLVGLLLGAGLSRGWAPENLEHLNARLAATTAAALVRYDEHVITTIYPRLPSEYQIEIRRVRAEVGLPRLQ